MPEKKTVKDLLTDEIKDLYSAEKQLTKAIPKMAKGSNDPALQTAFQDHLKETQQQVTRLEEVARLLNIKPTGKKCAGMEGVIKEGAEALEEDGDETILDLGIIGAGSRVEHYEMAGYLTAISLASRMKAGHVVTLLKQSLAEEQAAEQKLRSEKRTHRQPAHLKHAHQQPWHQISAARAERRTAHYVKRVAGLHSEHRRNVVVKRVAQQSSRKQCEQADGQCAASNGARSN